MKILGHEYGKVVTMAVAVFAIGGIARAYADPIPITSGNINFLNFDSASMGLTGPNGAELSGQIGGLSTGYVPPYACFSSTGGCAGQPANLSISDSVTSNPSGTHIDGGGMIVNGTRYTVNDFSYDITAGNIITPLNGSASTSFTFAATAVGTSSTGGTNTFDWTGAGTASAIYGPTGWSQSNYTFSAQSSPPVTPEPSAVLLLGVGVAGVLVGRRRRLLES